MKIQKCEYNNGDSSLCRNIKTSTPTFKSGVGDGLLYTIGSTTQAIQSGGFLVSFLIQDCLGMTMPRVGAAFLRDKDVTGTFNIQEGFEVLGREGLTGPCMMAVAPVMFALAAKFGKSTGLNSRLIKRFGNSLKEFLKSDSCKNSPDILKNKDDFKKLFYRDNVSKMLKNTLGENTLSESEFEKSISYILKQIENYENVPDSATLKGLKLSKKKYKYGCLENIEKHIDDLKYKTSSDLNMLNKVKFGSEELGDIKPFATIETIESMVKYSDDAIKANKYFDNLDENLAENIKNTSIAKRFVTTISTLAATLGVLSVLPKIYIKSNISPAERTAMKLREQEQQKQAEKQKAEEQNNEQNEVSFKRNPAKTTLFSKFGKFISGLQSKNEALANELEYKGHNFTNTLMASLSLLGLLLPRGLRAYNRAPVDENGKKDKSELYEILIRDITSTLAVVFAVPMLTRLFVSSYEDKTGFVLMKKNRNKSTGKRILELINPYSDAKVLSNKKLQIIYNANSQEKMINFCKYITENNGDLSKILSKAELSEELLKNTPISADKLASLSKADKNAKITEFFKGLDNSEETKKLIEKLFVGNGGKKGNKILSHAKGLNSIPTMLTMFFISPYILGWVIPRLTYANTRRMQEKKAKALNKTV